MHWGYVDSGVCKCVKVHGVKGSLHSMVPETLLFDFSLDRVCPAGSGLSRSGDPSGFWISPRILAKVQTGSDQGLLLVAAMVNVKAKCWWFFENIPKLPLPLV